jgi:hypothetical protein
VRPGRPAATTLTALVLLVGCTASPSGDPSLGASPASSSLPSTAAPSATPFPSPRSSTESSPSARLPSREADSASLRKALVTAADLGKPWVQTDSPPDSDEACPGTPSAVDRLAFRAAVRRDLTRGAGELINGASFELASLPSPDAAKVRAAWETDTRTCRQYTDTDDYYVVYRAAEPTTVNGADEVLLRRVERVYFDRGDDEPAYARHTLVARSGRVVATMTYSFLTSKSDPDATDFSEATELLQTQLTKAARAFRE